MKQTGGRTLNTHTHICLCVYRPSLEGHTKDLEAFVDFGDGIERLEDKCGRGLFIPCAAFELLTILKHYNSKFDFKDLKYSFIKKCKMSQIYSLPPRR